MLEIAAKMPVSVLNIKLPSFKNTITSVNKITFIRELMKNPTCTGNRRNLICKDQKSIIFYIGDQSTRKFSSVTIAKNAHLLFNVTCRGEILTES